MRRILFLGFLFSLLYSCERSDSFLTGTDSKIVFISRRIENSPDWNLLLMNKDGSQQEKLIEMTVRCENPVISHSGEIVLFVHYSEDHFYELYSINIDGTNLTLIDRAKRYCGSADWSADDNMIIYSRSRNESTDDKDIVLYDLISGSKESLTDTGNNMSARFSPENRIAYCLQDNTSYGIYLMNTSGSEKRLIIADANNPVWSPDGRQIAYISKGNIGSPQIFVADYNGSNSRQLTEAYLPCWDSGFPPFGNYDPKWTPDGRKIVYQSDINDGQHEIYIMNSNGTHQTRLTDSERRNEDPVITADGEYIVFASNRNLGYNSEIFVMNIDGRNQYALSKYAGDDSFPALAGK